MLKNLSIMNDFILIFKRTFTFFDLGGDVGTG